MESQTITFFPKYTALVGSAGGVTYYSEAFDVSEFKDVRVQVFAEVISNSGTATAGIEESSDLQTWTGVAVGVTVGTVLALSKTDPARYVRVKITVTAANAVGAFWAKGVARAA